MYQLYWSPARGAFVVEAVLEELGLKGELPMGLVVLKSGVTSDPNAIRKELVAKSATRSAPSPPSSSSPSSPACPRPAPARSCAAP